MDYPLGLRRSTVKCIFSWKQRIAKIQVISLPKISEIGKLNIFFFTLKIHRKIFHIFNERTFVTFLKLCIFPFWNLDSKSASLSRKNMRLKAGTPRECNNADCLLIFVRKPILVVYDVILGEKNLSWSFYINVYIICLL